MGMACVFPGQGSQAVGMGKAFAEAFASAREVLEEVDEVLKQKLSALMFNGPEDQLTLTENAQPAIMATSIAVLRVMEKELKFSLRDQAKYVAGHSLGEYSALCAAGALTLSDTAKLLRIRGQAMQQAVPVGQGAMAALLGLDLEATDAVAKEAAQGEVCSVANDNAPGQVVISGHKAAVERAVEIAKDKGAKRAVMLAVSAPFHCALMQPAAEAMENALSTVNMRPPAMPVVANVTASMEFQPEALKKLLVQQVTGRVRWRESVSYMKSQGITRMIEIGEGKVLSGLIKRIEPEVVTMNISSPADLDALAKAA